MRSVKVLRLDELKEGVPVRVALEGQPVLVAAVNGEVHAVSDVCLHRGGSLAAGPLEGELATCPLHFWTFNIRTGACEQVPSLVLKTFATRVENGEVYLET